MDFGEITKTLNKDLTKENLTYGQFEDILDGIDQGHLFIKDWIRDRKSFQELRTNPIFDGRIDDDGKGWFAIHDFAITIEILNKVLTPGGEVAIYKFGGQKKDLLLYYGLCPELENFISLVIWVDTNSSMQAWEHISELIGDGDVEKTLQFSKKCGILLPNIIHPSHDKDSTLTMKKFHKSLYDWKFAYYLFDDGKTILAHNSPLNFRRVILDEWSEKESVAEIRTTIGRLNSIDKNKIKATMPCISGSTRDLEFHNSLQTEENIKENSLYFFQIFKIAGSKNIELHVRILAEASPVDIVGMLLAHSIYLLCLGNRRLNVMSADSFKKLFYMYKRQVLKFCQYEKESDLIQINLDSIELKFTKSFTKWINSDLYIIPPLLTQFLYKFNLESQEKIIQKFDESLMEKKYMQFVKTPYNSRGNRMFTKLDMALSKKQFDYVHFLLCAKRFILKIDQNVETSLRDEEISWLKKQLNQ